MSSRLSAETIEALLVSILAVNRFSVERAWGLLPALRERDLTKPEVVAAMPIEKLVVNLASAGYDKGNLTGMFAERVQHLMAEIEAGNLDSLPELVSAKHHQAAIELLCRVKGIGRTVAQNALSLLD